MDRIENERNYLNGEGEKRQEFFFRERVFYITLINTIGYETNNQ